MGFGRNTTTVTTCWQIREISLKTETNPLPDSTQDEAYYQAWLEALCAIVTDKNITSARQIAEMKKRWVDAYIHTPHGQPVHLG